MKGQFRKGVRQKDSLVTVVKVGNKKITIKKETYETRRSFLTER